MKVPPSISQEVQNSKLSENNRSSKANRKPILKIGASANPEIKSSENSDAKVELSQSARELSMAKKAASDAPDVREDRVAELKSRIKSGSYEPDFGKIADNMIKNHSELPGF